MTVFDASVVVGALLGLDPGSDALGRLDAAATLGAPEVLIAEILGAIRRLERLGNISAHRARTSVTVLPRARG